MKKREEKSQSEKSVQVEMTMLGAFRESLLSNFKHTLGDNYTPQLLALCKNALLPISVVPSGIMTTPSLISNSAIILSICMFNYASS